jgi:hypothetical protein
MILLGLDYPARNARHAHPFLHPSEQDFSVAYVLKAAMHLFRRELLTVSIQLSGKGWQTLVILAR